jgi:glycosyltransferase involved in cell wall biosynthesis
MNLTRGPAVSIVVPVFSRAETVARAIGSAASQTFEDHEIVVVDDASTDGTVAAVESLGLEKLRLVRHAVNRGAAAARNSGVTAARGRWIAFLDSDDVWARDKLERQLAAMSTAAPAVRACATGFQLVRGERASIVRLDWTAADFRRLILFGCSISPGSTLLVERRAVDAIGPFDEKFRRLEDWDWLLRFARSYDLVFVPEPLATVYARSAPGSPERDAAVLDGLERIRAKHLKELPGPVDRQRLRSSLLIERAAIAWHRGDTGRAIAISLAGMVVYPFRNFAFFRMLARSFVLSFGPR